MNSCHSTFESKHRVGNYEDCARVCSPVWVRLKVYTCRINSTPNHIIWLCWCWEIQFTTISVRLTCLFVLSKPVFKWDLDKYFFWWGEKWCVNAHLWQRFTKILSKTGQVKLGSLLWPDQKSSLLAKCLHANGKFQVSFKNTLRTSETEQSAVSNIGTATAALMQRLCLIQWPQER